jgi:hypothetical protein
MKDDSNKSSHRHLELVPNFFIAPLPIGRKGGGQNLLKISAPLPLTNNFRMMTLLARSISLDSIFKYL